MYLNILSGLHDPIIIISQVLHCNFNLICKLARPPWHMGHGNVLCSCTTTTTYIQSATVSQFTLDIPGFILFFSSPVRPPWRHPTWYTGRHHLRVPEPCYIQVLGGLRVGGQTVPHLPGQLTVVRHSSCMLT